MNSVITTFFTFTLIGSLVNVQVCFADPSKIDPELNALLISSLKANVVVTFVNGVMPTLESTKSVSYNDRRSQNAAIIEALKENAQNSQASVVQTLSARAGDNYHYFKRYWISNKIFIKDASTELIIELSKDPEVKMIRKEPSVEIPKVNDADLQKEAEDLRGDDQEDGGWGVKRIQVPEAWAELDGNQGEGVIMGSIDTGVRHTHEAVRDNFFGIEYGWFDAVNNRTEPYDNDRHGTAVMGIIVGNGGIGVAPGAKWITCLACDGGWCPGEALQDCIQWMACPTLPDGSNEDCSKAPHIINNSWVTKRDTDDLDEDIMVWRAMGIIPIFGIGNQGPRCNSSFSPGEKSFVIGVGATLRWYNTTADYHFYKSSIGPAPDGTTKPDLVAPGVGVRTAASDSDTSYFRPDGTSIAAPHVSGVVALLKVRNPDLTYEEAYDLLTQNVDPTVLVFEDFASSYCNESTSTEVVPNNIIGYGRLNALKSIQAQTEALNKSVK